MRTSVNLRTAMKRSFFTKRNLTPKPIHDAHGICTYSVMCVHNFQKAGYVTYDHWSWSLLYQKTRITHKPTKETFSFQIYSTGTEIAIQRKRGKDTWLMLLHLSWIHYDIFCNEVGVFEKSTYEYLYSHFSPLFIDNWATGYGLDPKMYLARPRHAFKNTFSFIDILCTKRWMKLRTHYAHCTERMRRELLFFDVWQFYPHCRNNHCAWKEFLNANHGCEREEMKREKGSHFLCHWNGIFWRIYMMRLHTTWKLQ